MKKIFATLLITAPVLALANANGSGKVTQIGGQISSNSTAVYFGIEPAPVARAGCNNHPIYQFVFDASTDAGKALYSLLLSAKLANLTLTINGTGNCGIGGLPMEEVNYWVLNNE